MGAIEITVLRKADSLPLTKRITLSPDGSLMSNGSACVMSRGTAWRFGFTRIEEVAELIEHFGPDQALALGGIRSDLPARVEVVTKRKLNDATVPKSTPPVPTSLLAPATISPIDPANRH